MVALLTAGGPTLSEIPSHIGPCEFGMLGKLVTVRCPKELAHILRRAGAVWEPGSRRWSPQTAPIRSASRLTPGPRHHCADGQYPLGGGGRRARLPLLSPWQSQ